MSDKLVPLATGVAVALVIGFILSLVLESTSQQPKATEVVQSVCDYSRTANSTQWEESCGSAQDGANAEYLCNSVDTHAKCWVEQK